MLLWLFLAILLDRAQLQIGAFSYQSPFNGLGTVDLINDRNAKAPMAYRVLVPWFIGLLERFVPRLTPYRLTVYEAFKVVSLALALAACNAALGLTGTLLVGALLPVTFGFDYWCWAIELAAFAVALSGSLPLTVLGVLALSLSRETAPLVPLTYGLITHDWIGMAGLFVITGCLMLAVRLYVGKRPMYCDRFMIRRNLAELRHFLTAQPFLMDYSLMAILLSVVTAGVVLSGRAGEAWPVPLIILGLGWTMGIARETRIFTPVLLWIAMGILHP